jgi:hypothetical protein
MEEIMSKHILRLFVLIGVSLAIIAAVPGSSSEVVYFSGFADEVTIEPGQVGVYRFAWVNCSYGLSFDWINGTNQRYVVTKGDKELVNLSTEKDLKKGDWSDPYIVSYNLGGMPIEEHCAFPAENVWRIDWTHRDLRFDKPGTYHMEVLVETTQTMIDGFAALSELDVYEPQIFHNKTITITVQD